jgi:hypothetical protein
MPNDKEISTPVAFINGTIEVNGIPDASQDTVFVLAESAGPPTGQTSTGFPATQAKPEQGKKYSLTVTPGTWSVYARLGPVTTAKKAVSVRSGEAVEVDFSFGEDRD